MITQLLLGLSLVPHIAVAQPARNIHVNYRSGGYMPITIALPAEVPAGYGFNTTVTLSSAPPQNLVLAISTSQPAMFSSLPSYATVQAGQTSVTFPATLSALALGPFQLSASSSDGTIYGSGLAVSTY